MGTCYDNDEFRYCPILLRLNVQSMADRNDGKRYLLQIWDTVEKTKVYEKPLKSKWLITTKEIRLLTLFTYKVLILL